MPALAYIGLGANLGAARETVHAALRDLAAEPDIEVEKVARLYLSSPIDSSGPNYVNTVAGIRTSLNPQQLLVRLQQIELRHGRERPYANAPRTLDLDLLLYDDITLVSPALTIPHPRMHLRAFVLQPLLDVAGDLKLAQGHIQMLLTQCKGQGLSPLP